MREEKVEKENAFKEIKLRCAIILFTIVIILIMSFQKYMKIDSEILFYTVHGIFIVWIIKRNNLNYKKLIGKLPSLKDVVSSVGIFICVCIFGVASLFLTFYLMTFFIDINQVVGLNREVYSDIYTVKQTQSSTKVLLAIIGPMLLAPVFEEVLFRPPCRLSGTIRRMKIG